MKLLWQIFAFVVLAAIAEAEYRVERAAGKNCPRDFDYLPNGVKCKKCLKYRKKGTRANFRCPKGYGRYGNRFVVCRQDNTWSGGPPVCVKSGCAPIDVTNDVNLVMSRHPKFDDAVITFQCEADYLLFGASEIHCDGVQWSHAPPRCEAIADLIECDFENDLCGWTQNHTIIGNRNWTRHIGSTQTGGTGPKRDHTYPNSDTGHYMYFESSSPAMEGDSAILVSPPYTADLSPMCFGLWYHMLGPEEAGHVGSLEVYVKSESDDFNTLKPEFIKEGNQGDVWHQGEIYIDSMVESYQIIIKATKKKSYISDIAIDDVRLYNCTQTTTTTTTTAATTTPAATTPLAVTTAPANITATPIGGQSTAYNNFTVVTSNGSLVVSTKSPTTGRIMSPTTFSPVSGISAINTTMKYITATAKPATPVHVVNKTSTRLTTPTPMVKSTARQTVATRVTTRQNVKSTVTTTMIPTTNWRTTATTAPKSPPIVTKISSAAPSTTTKTTVPRTTTGKMTPIPVITTTTTTVTTPTPSTTVPPSTPTSTTSTNPTGTVTASTTPKPPTTVTTSPPTSTRPTTTSPKPTGTVTPSTTPPATPTAVSIKSSTTLLTKKGYFTFTALSTTTRSPTITISDSSKSVSSMPGSKATRVSGISSQTNQTPPSTAKGDNSSAPVTNERHPDDDTLKPLMIGLGVGIIVGLIIIGVIGWFCMRRRRFYTSRYEDELKPITNAASTQSLNNGDYYQDDFDIEHVQ